MTCTHRWHPTFWDGSRYCEDCELVEQETPRPPQKAGDATSEAEDMVGEIRSARARPLTGEDLVSLKRRIGWASSHSFDNDEVRRLVHRLERAERVATDLKQHVVETMEAMRLRPRLFGRPAELEAMWHVLLVIEANLTEPRTTGSLNLTMIEARAPIQRRHKWPGPIPLSSHGLDEAALMEVLWEMRANFLAILSAPASAAAPVLHWHTGPDETACGKSHRDAPWQAKATTVLAWVTCHACLAVAHPQETL